MKQHRLATRTFLRFGKVFAALFLCVLVCACLDEPTFPDTSQKIERIGIFVSQNGLNDSTLLKIHPSEEATLRAEVYPRQFKEEVSFKWFRDTMELGNTSSFVIQPYSGIRSIPNILSIIDKEGNSIQDTFNIVSNTPPFFDDETSPSDNETICANKNTAIQFSWNSFDIDYAYGDQNHYTLIIDDKEYYVGNLTNVMQSGFSEGEHTFKVIVADSYGDRDTLKVRTFFVSNCSGEK